MRRGQIRGSSWRECVLELFGGTVHGRHGLCWMHGVRFGLLWGVDRGDLMFSMSVGFVLRIHGPINGGAVCRWDILVGRCFGVHGLRVGTVPTEHRPSIVRWVFGGILLWHSWSGSPTGFMSPGHLLGGGGLCLHGLRRGALSGEFGLDRLRQL